MITREHILSVDDRRYETVHVREWGGDVRLASMTAAARLEFEKQMSVADASNGEANTLRQDAIVYMLVHSIVDEHGNRIFRDEDVEALGKKNPRILLTLFRTAAELNVVTSESTEQLKGN